MPVLFCADKALCALSQRKFQGLSDPQVDGRGRIDSESDLTGGYPQAVHSCRGVDVPALNEAVRDADSL
jgi:hypothetical protein